MFDKMKQMMEFKKQAEQLKRELENTRLEANDVRGIKVTVDGAQRFHGIIIADAFAAFNNRRDVLVYFPPGKIRRQSGVQFRPFQSAAVQFAQGQIFF